MHIVSCIPMQYDFFHFQNNVTHVNSSFFFRILDTFTHKCFPSVYLFVCNELTLKYYPPFLVNSTYYN